MGAIALHFALTSIPKELGFFELISTVTRTSMLLGLLKSEA